MTDLKLTNYHLEFCSELSPFHLIFRLVSRVHFRYHLKQAVEKNFKEVMHLIEQSLSSTGDENRASLASSMPYRGDNNSMYIRNSNMREVTCDLGDVADASSMVPQKLVKHDEVNPVNFDRHADVNYMMNPYLNPNPDNTPLPRSHALKPYTFVTIDPADKWKR